MNEGTCIHWTGLAGSRPRELLCKAGVCYYSAFNGSEPGIFLRLPCIQFRTVPAHGRGTYVKAGEPTVREEFDRREHVEMPCAYLHLPTTEEVEADRKRSDAAIERTMAAIRVASVWRVMPKPTEDRREVIECPVCKGRLHLSQAACNGHVHGKCETPDCVAWME